MHRIPWRRFDWHLFALAVVLGGFGVLMIASALSGNEVLAAWPWRQAGFLAIGIIALFAVATLDYRLLVSVSYPAYMAILGLLGIIRVVGTIAGGAQRWISVGEFFLQPSELIKLALILVLAHFLAEREERMGRLATPLGAILLTAPAVALVYLQPNLGTALVLLAISIAIILIAGLRWWQGAVMITALGAAAVPAWRLLLEDYMKDRILMFLNPEAALAADRYNVDQAMISIGSGGWLGRGLFRGSQSQLHFLRVRHTDFIFSVTAEELGFVGALLLILCFVLLMFRLISIASAARDTLGRLIVVGVIAMILVQMIINIGMNLSLMPVTGIPLPFVSYGGSSLLTVFIGIGLAESVAMRNRKIQFES